MVLTYQKKKLFPYNELLPLESLS